MSQRGEKRPSERQQRSLEWQQRSLEWQQMLKVRVKTVLWMCFLQKSAKDKLLAECRLNAGTSLC